MQYARRNLALYVTNRSQSFVVAPAILLMVAVIMIIIGLIIGIRTGLPLPSEVSEGFKYNQAIFWAIPGFLISHGALTANRGFAGSLAFGSTRRNFWAGTAMGFMVTSLVVVAVGLVLLAIESATGYGVGVSYLTITALDNGNPLIVAVSLFLMCLMSLFAGMSFGGIYRALGVVWTVISVVTVVLVVLGLVAMIVAWPDFWMDMVANLGRWTVPLGLLIATVIAAIASRTVVRFAEI
ncbi:MAG: hypothetical protein DI613_15220 [Kocuria rhizophila]|uniref:hypothetical protein n=1 Tax=Kocuria carniphila TaxID=262208 RepID=UPI000DB020CF|nr:hypothetical protein [Kocuria carniphila]MCT1801396.1 hypothetical protein [Kocuria carniphila]MDN5699763.1 hypothetical protein [Kocuria sp.]PZP26530.1 MAG: hypothetical protein DI613_15220 [Kocuria rhizophila]